jgi:hypothetical protein
MEPFKLLSKDYSLDHLSKKFAEIGLDLESSVVPDTAYEDSVLTFSCRRLPEDTIKIVVKKQWWDDGEKWEDADVRLFQNSNELLRIDLHQLLREKLNKPLRQQVMESLLDVASKKTLA